MKKLLLAAIIGSATCAAFAQTGLDLKGKMKEGQYETSFKMEIPGLPAGMGGFNNTVKSCVTKEDIEKGKGEMFRDPKSGKRETSCEMKNVRNSGNTVSYDMECPKEGMSSTTTMAFSDNSVKGLTKMKMSGEKAAKMPPGMGDMQMQFESKFLGPTCTK
ncbi:MAG: DUF3617 family protein [Betaproteobacteria bacterium]